MANVARLDSRLKREFVEIYFRKHPNATLTAAYEELRKKFKQGMAYDSIRIVKEKVLAEREALKQETQGLRTEGIPEHIIERRAEEDESAKELKGIISKAAEAMGKSTCPIFKVILTRGANGKVEAKFSQRKTVTDTVAY